LGWLQIKVRKRAVLGPFLHLFDADFSVRRIQLPTIFIVRQGTVILRNVGLAQGNFIAAALGGVAVLAGSSWRRAVAEALA
jgi:hypothetical protein